MNPLSQIIVEWFQILALELNRHQSPPTCKYYKAK